MYVLGVMTTMLKVLTFLTLKGLTIGMVLLTVAYTYSIKKHHGHHHGHIAHAHYEPATIIKTASHSYPHHHVHVPKYHSHYSSFHHPHHHHHHPHHHHGHHRHYPHKSKYYFTPPPHYHHHHDSPPHHHHHPEQIEIVKDVHVHSVKPHLHHKEVSPPETHHTYEVVKDSPVIEYPHKHVHTDYHSVKKRYPLSQPIVEYANSNDNNYHKLPKKNQKLKPYEQSSGLQFLYDIQKDYSKYAANEGEYSNNPYKDPYKESEFSPVNQHKDYPPHSPPGYGVSYAGSAGDYGASQASFPPSNIPVSYADINVGGGYSGDAAGSYAGSNVAGSGYTSNSVAGGYGSSSVSGGYGSSNQAGSYGSNSLTEGYATSNVASDFSGGSSQESYVNNAAAPTQSEVKNEYTSAYFTNHKDYMNSIGNTEEYSNPVVNNQYDYRNTYSADSGESVYSNQYQNNYATDQQNDYNGASAPTYNKDSSYDSGNTFELSSNKVKYSANKKYRPLTELQNAYKSNSAPFVVNIPNLPGDENDDTSDEKKNTSEESSEEDSLNFQESMDSPTFEAQKTTSYDSRISSPFGESNSYNDQQSQTVSSNSQNNFESSNDSTNNLGSDVKNKNYDSSNSQSRDTFTNKDDKTMQELEFEPAWAYILFNNQNSTSSPSSSNALDRRMDVEASHHSQMPVIKC